MNMRVMHLFVASFVALYGIQSFCAEVLRPIDQELFEAASRGNRHRMKRLVEQGANVNATGPVKGETPLMYAVQGMATLEDTVNSAQLLINNCADVNARDEEGNTPLLWALQNERLYFHQCALEALELIRLLIDNGADVNAKNNAGRYPLMLSITKPGTAGGEEIPIELIRRGADVNAQDKLGNTPLMGAVHVGRAFLVDWLIEQGADVDVANNRGITALSIAKSDGIKRLLVLAKFRNLAAEQRSLTNAGLTVLAHNIIDKTKDLPFEEANKSINRELTALKTELPAPLHKPLMRILEVEQLKKQYPEYWDEFVHDPKLAM